jgi:hypothetical protein
MKQYFGFDLLEELQPSIVSLIAAQTNNEVGFVTALYDSSPFYPSPLNEPQAYNRWLSPIFKDGGQKLNLSQNEFRDLVIHFNPSCYGTNDTRNPQSDERPYEDEINIQLTDHADDFSLQQRSRINSTVRFMIPFGVPTLKIGHVKQEALSRILPDTQSPAELVNYVPENLLSNLGPEATKEIHLWNTGFLSSVPFVEPDYFWDTLSRDQLPTDDTDSPQYSTIL